jgi:hypothetical protein
MDDDCNLAQAQKNFLSVQKTSLRVAMQHTFVSLNMLHEHYCLLEKQDAWGNISFQAGNHK